MKLLIESFEGDIYLGYQVLGNHKELIKDDNQQPLKFSSLEHAKAHFTEGHYHSATLVHCSTYDEMCGEHDGISPTMEVDLGWK